MEKMRFSSNGQVKELYLPYLLTEGQVLLWSSFFVLVPELFPAHQ